MQGQSGSIDADLTRSGGMSGGIGFGSEVGDALLVGGTAYVVMNAATFRAVHQSLHLPLSACARVCGDYLRLPHGLINAITLPALTSQLEANFPAAASVTTIRLVTYQGQRVYELSNPKGQILYVARGTPHYPLEIVDPSEGPVYFSKWNAVPPIKAPPPSQVVNH